MPIINISPFTKQVLQSISKIPTGKVATYKQIAELAGKPQGSRGVAWILHSCSTTYKLPWHRVLSSKGKISFERNTFNFRQQKKLLEREGVTITPTGELNLKKYQWSKRAKKNISKTRPSIFS